MSRRTWPRCCTSCSTALTWTTCTPPAAAEEYARRLAQRGIPMAALLRAYRLGAARFHDWCLEELGRRTDNASIVTAAGLRIADATAGTGAVPPVRERVAEELQAGGTAIDG